MKISRALISVSDKEGIEGFARSLASMGVEIISTGGTARKLDAAGVKSISVEELTGFPEMLDGRVKTLHPKVHAGILVDREKEAHLEQIKRHGIKQIDLVVVNLYPFREVASKAGVPLSEAIENIDIGGPAMVRSAAKNFDSVAVVVNPARYREVLDELQKNGLELSLETRKKLALEAFELTAQYDAMVSDYLREHLGSGAGFPEMLSFGYLLGQRCRYGENPHQKGAFYRNPLIREPCVSSAKLLHGKEMSYNNWNDADATVELLKEFHEKPAAVIVKHANPCGAAVAGKLEEAFSDALDSDSKSAFGGIIALNRECDLATAKKITSFFNELVVAPSFEDAALGELKKKKNLRVLELPGLEKARRAKGREFKKLCGGLLVQDRNLKELRESDLKTVSVKRPSKEDVEAMLFGWKVAKHVKSNAVLLVQGTKTVGIGMGQTSRVDAVEICLRKAGSKVRGAILVSDAFFPFRDSVDLAAKKGVKGVLETGGSLRDEEVIRAADEHKIFLVFSGQRAFRH